MTTEATLAYEWFNVIISEEQARAVAANSKIEWRTVLHAYGTLYHEMEAASCR